MGLFKDMMEGFANGFVSATANSLRAGSQQGLSSNGPALIERLCQEVGWTVDERTSDGVVLYFNDPVVRIRKVIVTEGSKLMLLSTFSGASIPASRVPAEVMGYLLTRNTQMAAGAWQASVMDNDRNVSFALAYYALVGGLDGATFKIFCEAMVKEAHEFDVKMKAAGLL
jgi:hypothetical protein